MMEIQKEIEKNIEIELEDQILKLLKEENKALSVFEIEEKLNLNKNELTNLMKTLNKLEQELKIYKTKKDNYMLFTNSNLKLGKMLMTTKGYGFVDIGTNEDIFIPADSINKAIHNDTVVVEITSKGTEKPEGRIVKIVDRNLNNMIGEVYFKQGKPYIDLDDKKMKIQVALDPKKTKGAMPGHKVIVKITNKLQNNNYKGEIIKILGHKNDPGVDILSITAKYEIKDTFPEEVMEQADELPSEVLELEKQNRKDLTKEEIFTIDGDDTKDIDDAISYKKLPNGNHQLGVHIADVSHYVTEDSPLDKEAYERGTSVYLADRVIPMLPHKLSNGICSLNPEVERLATSCVMEINENGDIVNYDIFKSIIKSNKQMTYKNVNKILEENIIPEGYEPFANTLKQMGELAKILRKNKINRGYIDFDIDESKIIVDETGKAIDVKLRERGTGEKLIEDFMIAANESVATYIYNMDLPFVYRIHGEPSEEKIDNFIKFISILGYKITANRKVITPKSMQEMLEQLKDKEEYPILSSILLRSMQKAIYDKNNIGHFGLASKCYTHFTSPIRRYPDLMVHRLLNEYIFKNNINEETINKYDYKLKDITAHSSERERASIECEREVDDMKKAEYMQDHIGEEYEGMISSVMPFGMFVELPNLVEGLVHIDDLEGDHYMYNEETFSIIGTKDKRGYRLGDKVRVVVKSANKEEKTIDFTIKK